MWLGFGLIALWLFAFHLSNPWDIVSSTTSQNAVVFLAFPLYLLILNADLLDPWQSLNVVRLGSTRLWWWTHVPTAWATATLFGVGVAVLAVVVPVVSHRWSWGWGTYGLNSEVPTVLARPPWNVPWHWSLEALGYFVLGLWAVGVMRHVLTLWWRGPWLAWLLMVAMGLASLAVSHTFAQGAVWWLPGTQFSFYYHWTAYGSYSLRWTLAYATFLLGLSAAVGLGLAQDARWKAPQ